MPHDVTRELKTDATLLLHESDAAKQAYDLPYNLRDDEERILQEFFPTPPARVLDLGCGNGRTTVPLARRGYEVVGIEYSPSLVELAKQHRPDIDVQHGDARQLKFADESFDVAFFSWNGMDYMHPVSDRLRVLTEVRRVVKSGGLYVFSSRNALGCLGRLLQGRLMFKRALGFWRDQIPTTSDHWSWYFVWRDAALGTPVFYSGPPCAQRRLIEEAGWVLEAMRPVERLGKSVSAWRDVHIYYVCRRP